MHREAIVKILDAVKNSVADAVVLELTVEKINCLYSIVGVYMHHTETHLRVAFNAKNTVVIDDADILLQEIQTLRVVREEEIEIIGGVT